MKSKRILDVRGLYCPMPVIKTKKALEELAPGEVLEVRATDVASKADIPALLSRVGHCLIDLKEEDDTIVFLIRKGD